MHNHRVWQDQVRDKKLRVVKEQILIRLLGLGWEEACHPWSRGGRTYTADELFNHLIDVVIPLADWLVVPSNSPASLPPPPDLQVIGTKASIDMREGSAYAEEMFHNCKMNLTKKENIEKQRV